MNPENNCHNLKTGDVLYSSWGYDQTNIEFFKVIRATAKSVTIKALKSRAISGDGWTGEVVPTEEFDEKYVLWFGKSAKTCRVFNWGDGDRIRVHDCGTARKWDGQAKHYTAYA